MAGRAARLMFAAEMLPVLALLASCIPPASDQAEPAQRLAQARPAAPAAAAPRPPANTVLITLDQPSATATITQGSVLRGRIAPADAELTFNGTAVPVAADGGFIIAFDRDAAATAELRGARGTMIPAQLALSVAAGGWRIEQVNANFTGGAASSAEFQRRRGPELAQISAARRVPGISDGWRQRCLWPVRGRVSGLFGAQRVYRGQPGSYHSGVDVAASTGTEILAPADGVVTLAAASPFTLEGNLLILDHGMGLNSAFLHNSSLMVREGDVVRQGQVIARVGATGRASGPHMHWGMRWRDARIDPARLAGAMTAPAAPSTR